MRKALASAILRLLICPHGIQAGRWLFTASKPQAKDDIAHAFAALYVDPATGDTILYAGLDRFDNSGDATAGFWFFVNPIGENPNVTTNGGHPFTGTHTTGDILLVSDFTTGGSVSTIKVFEWVGDDATGGLVPLNNGNPINGSTFAVFASGCPPQASSAQLSCGQWSRPALLLMRGVRPNSPQTTTDTSWSSPRA